MNAPSKPAFRRGACPGLSAPMVTGDGLLARLTSAGSTITLDAFDGLCRAARRHGNGVLEVTSRGSIQIRGLRQESAPLFAADVAALGVEAHDGIPVLVDPLCGLGDATDIYELAADLRKALESAALAERVTAKLSVIVDGGDMLHLDDLPADVRLRAADGAFHLAIGGDAESAVQIGRVKPASVVACVLAMLNVLAERAPQSRMRDAIRMLGLSPLAAAIDKFVTLGNAPPRRPRVQPIGLHRIGARAAVLGIGLPFGHSDAEQLARLIEVSREFEAAGVRPTPDRALLVIGLSPDTAIALRDEIAALSFITDPADPRRRVVACPGAPICASGEIPARAVAPAVAEATREWPGNGIIHVSGCAKGCAHQGAAAVALIGRDGRCDIAVDGVTLRSVASGFLAEELAALSLTRRGAL